MSEGFERLRTISIVALLFAALGFLYAQASSRHDAQHERISLELNELLRVDAELARDALRVRAGLLRQYDPINTSLERLALGLERLRSEGRRDGYGDSVPEIDAGLEKFAKSLADTEERMEQLKSGSAMLRNSLAYLPTLQRELNAMNGFASRGELGALTNALLRFAQNPGRDSASEAETLLERLAASPGPEPLRAGLETFAAHARLVLTFGAGSDETLRGLFAVPPGDAVREVRKSYLDHYRGTQERADQYRALLFVVSLLLIAYLGYLMLRLNATARGLRKSQVYLRAIVDNEPECVKVTDADCRLMDMNPAGLAMVGADSLAQLRGGSLLDLVVPEHREAYRAFTRGVLSGAPGTIQFEAVGLKGARRWFDTHAVAIEDARGSRQQLLGITRDITDRVRAERELQELNRTLEQRVADRTAELHSLAREREAFSYSIAHDLRSPLGVISGFCHVLRKDEQMRLSVEGRRMLEVIEGNVAHLVTLVDALLALAQVSRAKIEHRNIHLRQIAAAAAETLAQRYPGARIELGLLPETSGDPTLVAQALFNLLENALKYSSRAPVPRVEIGWQPEIHAVYVRDNGVGFDMRHTENLFNAFERLHPEADFPGSGIGLAIVKRIVERHGGRVWADAAPGAGATFFFTLAGT